MPRPPNRYPSPQISQTRKRGAAGADAMIERKADAPETVSPSLVEIPSWALDGILEFAFRQFPNKQRAMKLPGARKTIVRTAFILDELDRLSGVGRNVFKSFGGKTKTLARLLRDLYLKKEPKCPDVVLSLHAGLLQQALTSTGRLSGRAACKKWLDANLCKALSRLKTIPCGCEQKTAFPSQGTLEEWLNPYEQGAPTSTTLLYSILAYHHNLQPETVRKRLRLQNEPR